MAACNLCTTTRCSISIALVCISEAAFEVATAVIDDKVMKGKWTIKDGKPTFKPWRFWPAKTAEEQFAEAEAMDRVLSALRGEDPDEIE